ncbi:MAG: hypothetical protein RL150_612 [Candidatus Parcubacteria bacterium]|jgi:hypothetical protein
MKLTDDPAPNGAPAQHEIQTETVETATAKIVAAIATINSAQKRDPSSRKCQCLRLTFGNDGSFEQMKKMLTDRAFSTNGAFIGHIDMESPLTILVCVACKGDSVTPAEMRGKREALKPKSESDRPTSAPINVLEQYRTRPRGRLAALMDGSLSSIKEAKESAPDGKQVALGS